MNTEGQNTEECRAAFEKWCDTPPNELRTSVYADDGHYIMMETRIAWDAWQEAWNTHTESGPVEELVEALEEVAGCFDAAYSEGLLERLSDESSRDIGSLYDLITRRVLHAHPVAVSALAKAKPTDTPVGVFAQPVECSHEAGSCFGDGAFTCRKCGESYRRDSLLDDPKLPERDEGRFKSAWKAEELLRQAHLMLTMGPGKRDALSVKLANRIRKYLDFPPEREVGKSSAEYAVGSKVWARLQVALSLDCADDGLPKTETGERIRKLLEVVEILPTTEIEGQLPQAGPV